MPAPAAARRALLHLLAGLLIVGSTIGAAAVDGRSAERATPAASVSGAVLDVRNLPVVGATIALLRSNGEEVTVPEPAISDKHGRFAMRGVAPGVYRLQVTVNFDPAYGVHANTDSASFFWSRSGPKSSFAEASPIRIANATASRPAQVFSATLHAPGGARAVGSITGGWEDSVAVDFERVRSPGETGPLIGSATWATLDAGRVRGAFTTFQYRSTPLRPGTYRLSSWSYTVNAKGHVVGSNSFYYRGAGVKPTTSRAKAALIVVEAGMKTIRLGAFDQSR